MAVGSDDAKDDTVQDVNEDKEKSVTIRKIDWKGFGATGNFPLMEQITEIFFPLNYVNPTHKNSVKESMQ